ncbi:uncharacterized protein EDB91DRAFT_1088181 [Suillus paluster]|uniref:uncharacterized protein n=1 Tax=Suillus paluster TaxID=48578 RepID=UPI001B884468|nr:uncharacterized protein EDB91DRAFT_1088181 [Suillus paluster]KAG1722326.1 hypothetical protein EDB91DRAFT_1088181 [Suillus paluster]
MYVNDCLAVLGQVRKGVQGSEYDKEPTPGCWVTEEGQSRSSCMLLSGKVWEKMLQPWHQLMQWNYRTKMAPRTWLMEEQLAFNATFEEEYLTTFWQPFFKKWEEQWPARASVFPDIPLVQALTATQLEEEDQFKTALQKHLTVKFRNDYGNSKPGHKAAAAGNLAVHRLLSNIVTGPTTGAPNHRKTNIQVVWKHIDRCWKNESVEVKQEISQLTREMREAGHEVAKERKSSKVANVNDLIIPRLTEILSTFFGELHEATGWTFSVLLGGPDPSNRGAIDVSSLHVGSTKLAEAGTSNQTVAQSLEDEDLLHISPAPDDIPTNDSPRPMTTAADTLHGSHTASLQPDLASIMPTTELGQEKVVTALPEDFFQNMPSAPQDNEIDQELNMPILSMPEGYVPFCPPPPLSLDATSTSGSFDLDLDLESFDDALKSMQSQDTITGMFDNIFRFSSPTATASTTSTITHLPAVTDTMPAITPFTTPSATPCTTPVVTRCTMPATTRSPAFAPSTTPVVTPCTTPAITHSPVVASSTTPATAPLPAAPTTPVTPGMRPSPGMAVDEPPAKHQKKARCTHAGETDPPQPVGRGKWQQFQST